MDLQNKIDSLIELLNKQKKKMETVMLDFAESQKEIQNEISNLSLAIKEQNIYNGNLVQNNKSKIRQPKISWGDLSIDILAKQNHIMTAGEILDCLFPEQTREKKIELGALLSSALYKLCEGGKITKLTKKPRKNYYGLTNWFDQAITPWDIPELKKEYDVVLTKTHLKIDAL